MSESESEQSRRGPGRPRKNGGLVDPAVEAINKKTSANNQQESEKNKNFCPVCHSSVTAISCLITKTFTDQRGMGFKGLICTECGTIRLTKGKTGQFIYGYEDNWKLQE